MPTRRTFDLLVMFALLSKPAFGLVKMYAARAAREEDGVEATAARAALVVF